MSVHPTTIEELRAALAEKDALVASLRARLRDLEGERELVRLNARAKRLTDTERQVAELVVSGRTNFEVSQALYLSEKTVEWNLTKIYRKLYARSRTELAAKLVGEPKRDVPLAS